MSARQYIYRTPEGEAACKAAYARIRAAWPVPREELRLPTRHGETFVIASGDPVNPPLVLLHGAGSNSFMWMGDVAAWALAFRVYAVDILGEPGESASNRPPRDGSQAEWLDDVFAALGVERAALAGLSLGGWHALDYAIRRPERVTRLALLAPGGLGAVKLGFLVRAALLGLTGAKGRERLLASAGASAPGPIGKYLGLIFTHFRPRRHALPRFAPARLATLKMPMLLIVGAKDELLDSEGSRRRLAAACPHARIVVLPEVGHAVLGQTQPVFEFLTAP